jgi:hypothetical protein
VPSVVVFPVDAIVHRVQQELSHRLLVVVRLRLSRQEKRTQKRNQ